MLNQGRRIRCLSSCMEELHSVSLPALVSRICSFSRPDGCRWMQDILILLASLVGMTWGFRKFDPHRTFMDSTSYCSWTLQFQTCGGPSLAKPFSLSQSRIRLRCPISRTVARFATRQILLAVVFLLHAADGAMLPGIFKAGSADVCSQQGIHVVP